MAKNKKKAGKVINFQPISLENYIKSHARKLPVLECWQTENINGLSQVKVVRKKANGKLIVGFYLIDMYCFGLKDTFYLEFEDYEDYESQALNKFSDDAVGQTRIEADYAFNLVYGAIEYGEDNGFKVPKAFKVSEYILDDIEDIEFIDIEFGMNGQPLYIPGP